PVGTGLPNVYVTDLTLTTDQASLVAWTHGRGAYSLPLPPVSTTAPIVDLPAPVRDVDTRIGIGGFTGQITPGSDKCFTLGGVNGVPSDAAFELRATGGHAPRDWGLHGSDRARSGSVLHASWHAGRPSRCGRRRAERHRDWLRLEWLADGVPEWSATAGDEHRQL